METKICKLVMLGDFSVGKSSFFDVLINGKFEEYPTAITIGVAFNTHTLKDDQGNVLVKFNIWVSFWIFFHCINIERFAFNQIIGYDGSGKISKLSANFLSQCTSCDCHV